MNTAGNNSEEKESEVDMPKKSRKRKGGATAEKKDNTSHKTCSKKLKTVTVTYIVF